MTTGPTAAPPLPDRGLTSGVRTWIEHHPDAFSTGVALAIFLSMIIYGELAYGRVVQPSTLSNLLINNAHLVIMSLGMTGVIITGGIDLSVGSVLAFSSVSGVMLAGAGVNPWIVVMAMIAIGSVAGLVSGVLIAHFGMPPFIATLAMMFLTRGLASTLSTVPQRLDPQSPIRDVAMPITLLDGPRVNDLVVTPGVLIAVVAVLVGLHLLHRTRTGRTAYAIGGSASSAELMGLAVRRTTVLVYVISGTLTGLATVVYTARLGTAQNITGIGWELDAIAAAVIGGTVLTGGSGFLLGSVVGALVLGLMTVLITFDGGVPAEMTTIITGGILLAFVLLQRAIRPRR